MEKDPTIDPRAEGKYLEKLRRDKQRADDKARMDRIEAKLDMLLGNAPRSVRVYDADGDEVSPAVTYTFSGTDLQFEQPARADEIIESLKVLAFLPDLPHWLYIQDEEVPSRFNKVHGSYVVRRSCNVQAQQVQELIPV